MSETFKALVINQEGENFSRGVRDINFDFIKDGDVLVKVDYSDLNFKDALILKDGAKLVKNFPRIPGIDFSGTVAESNTDEFKEGDEVILTGCRVGEIYHGGYSQYVRVNKSNVCLITSGPPIIQICLSKYFFSNFRISLKISFFKYTLAPG